MAISEARQRANAKYNKKAYDRLEMKVPKGKKAEILAHAEKQGESLNKFLNRAVDETLERDVKKEQGVTLADTPTGNKEEQA